MPYTDAAKSAAYMKDYFAERKAIVNEAKSCPCADCGVQHPWWVMEFDHVRGEKVGNINRLRYSCGPKRLREEIAKCDVVCANCHRDRTYHRASLSQLARGSRPKPD